VLHEARWKYKRQKFAQNSPSGYHRTTLSACIFATKACIDNRKKVLNRNNYLPHISPQYSELRPISGWDRLANLGHPSKFQRVSRVGFVIAATSLNGSQLNFARCLAVSCTDTLYNTFSAVLAPWQNFSRCKFHFASRFCVLILAASLHGTSAAGVSQTLRRWEEGAIYIRQGGHHVGHGPTLYIFCFWFRVVD